MALSKTMKILFFVSGATYVLGAIGFEMIGGSMYINSKDMSLPYMLVMTVEETLEMTGIILFIFTLLLYLKSYAPNITMALK
jgi:hypothetical protein